MTKYSNFQTRATPQEREKKPHAIWRGIGFVMMLIIPVMSWFGSVLLVQYNLQYGWYRIPSDLISKVIEPYLYVKIIITIVLMIILFGGYSMIAFLIYRFFGPPRYGPMDVPPVAYRGKQYKR